MDSKCDGRTRLALIAGALLWLAGCPAQEPGPDLAAGADLAAPGEGEDDLAGPPPDLRGDMPAPDVDLRPAQPPGTGLCTPPPNRWCWENPLPQGNELLASWASSATDVWAAGWSGTMMHFDGTSWSLVPSGTDEALWAMWGSAADDVWAVGTGGTMVRWNGAQWSRVPSGTTTNFTAIWGTGRNDAWAGGNSTSLWRWDGMRWQEMPDVAPSFVRGLWGSSPKDYWVATSAADKAAAHWDGTRWTQPATFPTTMGNLRGVYGTGPSNVFLLSNIPNRWNGMTFDNLVGTFGGVPNGSMWASSPTDVWALTTGGSFNRWGGTMWSGLAGPSLDLANGEALHTFKGVTEDDVWAFSNRPHHWYGGKWESIPGETINLSFQGGWATGLNDAWLVGITNSNKGFVLRRIAGRWLKVFDAPHGLLSVWASSSNDVRAVGSSGLIVHWDGVMWKQVPSGTTNQLRSVRGFDTRNVIAVGYDGTILKWSGTDWNLVPSSTSEILVGSWVSGINDSWACGFNGTLLRWDGMSWKKQTISTSENLIQLWASSTDSVWLVGGDGIFKWDGTRWMLVENRKSTYSSIYGSSPNDIWAVGSVMSYWNGTSWSTKSRVTGGLSEVFGASGTFWAAGRQAAIIRFDP